VNLRKTILTVITAALTLLSRQAFGEEQHSVMTALSSTTLSGYVDTSASWWTGSIDGSSVVRPANDFAAMATPIEIGQVAIPTNLTSATLESGEPVNLKQIGSVWYRWTANANGAARISTTDFPVLPIPTADSLVPALFEESIFYGGGGITWGGGASGYEEWRVIIGQPFSGWWLRFSVYRATGISMETISLDAVARGESVQFDVQADETFWIAVEVYSIGQTDPTLSLTDSGLPAAFYLNLTTPPANDSLASALTVTNSAAGTMVGYMLAATRETGEPDIGTEFSSGSVWFDYTAATYGTVRITSATNAVPLAVFTGNDLAGLNLITKGAGGGLSFFGEEGKTYHVAAYRTEASASGFTLNFSGPQYRLYETNVDGLMPGGQAPHFYGVRGVTMLLYAKSATGWNCVEIEPIVNQAADLLIHPAVVVDGQLRVITIDESMPSPHVKFRSARGLIVPDLIGYPGQTCAVSFSTDLVNWSEPKVYTLDSPTRVLEAVGASGELSAYFSRVTQSFPLPPISSPTGYGGVIMQRNPRDVVGASPIPTPPVPSL
jgi:hypothetical protein